MYEKAHYYLWGNNFWIEWESAWVQFSVLSVALQLFYIFIYLFILQ